MDSNLKPPSLVTRKEAAIFLRSSLKFVDRLIRDGRIRSFKIGSKVLIYEETLSEENINSIKPKFL
jgi:excisionase family DNA binding protein